MAIKEKKSTKKEWSEINIILKQMKEYPKVIHHGEKKRIRIKNGIEFHEN